MLSRILILSAERNECCAYPFLNIPQVSGVNGERDIIPVHSKRLVIYASLLFVYVCVQTLLHHASSPFLALPELCTSVSRGSSILAFYLELALGIILCTFAVFFFLFLVFLHFIKPWGCEKISTKTTRFSLNWHASRCHQHRDKIAFLLYLSIPVGVTGVQKLVYRNNCV